MKGLVFEIGTEEMPSGFISQAMRYWEEEFPRRLSSERITFEGIKVLGTPRRLAILGRLSESQRPLETVQIGPPKKVAFDPEGRPTRAALGFASKEGVDVSELVVVETEKGEYVAVKREQRGKETKEVLSEILPRMVTSLPLPKAMRWADGELRFIRPIHWVLALFGDEVVPFELDGIRSSSFTRGHRFLAPSSLEIRGAEVYEEELYKAYVIADPQKRRERVREAVEGAARRVGGVPLIGEELLEEVTNLLEWPVAVEGRFDEEFLDLPREVLITAMEHHQRYFPVVDREGRLLPFFVAVSNTEPKDLEVVRQGNERVLKARLADARFFFEEDLKVPLEERVEELKGMVFQAQLGTLYEKTLRVKELAGRLAERVAPHAKEAAQRAAYLSKVDLLTEMVGEFPQLQGVMGREYALRSGERPEVAQAIFEHYLPRSAGDRLPESDAGAIVSVADKIDTVVGCFGVGLVPTGTSDPFALRRQTLGIINIILEKGYRLSLKELIGWASELLRERMEREKVEEQVLEFFRGRYENLLFPEGWGREEVAAVLNVQMDDLVDARRRIEALSRMRPLPEFESMVVAFKRVANIVRGTDYPQEPDPSLFIEEQERELYETFQGVKEEFQRLFEAEDYEGILRLFSRMRPAVDAFFDNVLVMEEDKRLRQNRLSLLGKINDLFTKIADFSVLT